MICTGNHFPCFYMRATLAFNGFNLPAVIARKKEPKGLHLLLWGVIFAKELHFQNESIPTFKRNKKLKELIDSNTFENNKVKTTNITKEGKCIPCLVNFRILCSKQLLRAKSYKIFHEVNSSSIYVIYLMNCTLCKKQEVGNKDTSFSIRVDNDRKDVKKPDAILAYKHIQNRSHVFNQEYYFNKHAKSITISQPTNITKSNPSHVRNAVKFHCYISKTI